MMHECERYHHLGHHLTMIFLNFYENDNIPHHQLMIKILYLVEKDRSHYHHSMIKVCISMRGILVMIII